MRAAVRASVTMSGDVVAADVVVVPVPVVVVVVVDVDAVGIAIAVGGVMEEWGGCVGVGASSKCE